MPRPENVSEFLTRDWFQALPRDNFGTRSENLDPSRDQTFFGSSAIFEHCIRSDGMIQAPYSFLSGEFFRRRADRTVVLIRDATS
jgi:hypothetical protein